LIRQIIRISHQWLVTAGAAWNNYFSLSAELKIIEMSMADADLPKMKAARQVIERVP
jgi:hypothetical protein